MPARMIVELSPERQILFGGKGAEEGLSEAAFQDQFAKVTTATREQFKKALLSLADLTNALEESVRRIEHRPEKIEMEFKASLTGTCDLWIVSGEGEAEIKVTLAWGKTG